MLKNVQRCAFSLAEFGLDIDWHYYSKSALSIALHGCIQLYHSNQLVAIGFQEKIDERRQLQSAIRRLLTLWPAAALFRWRTK
jgi:hypothetical protein